MRTAATAAAVVALGAGLASCGERRESGSAAVPLPASGRAYRALDNGARRDVAASCRDRAAARTDGVAAKQLAAVDVTALRDQLDSAYQVVAWQPRPVARVCAHVLPFVTPGLALSIPGAHDDGDGTYSVQTRSDRPLTIRGRIAPAPARGGRVIVRREPGHRPAAIVPIAADGQFVAADLRLRKVADNTFTLTIDAAPNAPRKVLFTAICLDCLAGGQP